MLRRLTDCDVRHRVGAGNPERILPREKKAEEKATLTSETLRSELGFVETCHKQLKQFRKRLGLVGARGFIRGISQPSSDRLREREQFRSKIAESGCDDEC